MSDPRNYFQMTDEQNEKHKLRNILAERELRGEIFIIPPSYRNLLAYKNLPEAGHFDEYTIGIVSAYFNNTSNTSWIGAKYCSEYLYEHQQIFPTKEFVARVGIAVEFNGRSKK